MLHLIVALYATANPRITDGAWPPSGINPTTDTYQYDSSPAHARQSSLFTFLIYLNDDFKGGETTFFIPSIQEGVMNAYPVQPMMGSVAVFPHGESQGALLHEGTGVVEGAKYVIRTDVEYEVGITTTTTSDESAAVGVKRSVISE